MKKKNSKKLTKNQLMIIAVVAVVLIVIIALIINKLNKIDSMNDLKITYNKGQTIQYSNFKKNFTEERTITVKNTSKESRTFSLEWEGVENTLTKQNNFTYEIKCTGDRCATLGMSQVPVAGFKVYQLVLIEGGQTQTYTVIFTYKGSEKKAHFTGRLKVYSEKIIEEKPNEELVRKPEAQKQAEKANTKNQA